MPLGAALFSHNEPTMLRCSLYNEVSVPLWFENIIYL